MAAKMGNNYPLTSQAMDLAAVPSRGGDGLESAGVPHAGDVETGSHGDGSSTKEKYGGEAEGEGEGNGSEKGSTEEIVQDGVQQARAITATWSRKNLYAAYTFMWMLYAVNAFQSSITGNLAPFITSNFESHSLLPTIGIVANILSAVAYMVLAKVLNLWDRTYGFSVMALFAVIGLILSATCTNVYAYSAAQCFYSVGFIGIIFAVDVSTADTSSLRDRGFAYAFTASPWIICAYAGAKIAERFYENNWRWAYGIFAIILPFVALGYVTVFQLAKRRAVQVGELKKPNSGRTLWESTKHYIVEFDVIGVFLISAGLSLFLLPFSIAESAAQQWRSAHIIVMLVLGVALLIAFGFYEKYWSPKPFVPFHLLANRTIIGSCILQLSWQIAYYSWYSYYTSYLMVVYDLSVSHAGYVASIYDVVAGVWLLPVGYAIRRTGRYKWFMWFALPCYALGVGLMIRFRNPGYSVGWMAFCNILIAFGGSTFTLTEQVAVLAASSHNDAAAALAMLGLFGYFGGAIGGSMCGAIWTHTFPKYLLEFLPEESQADFEAIYEDLYTQISYEVGSPTRMAIEHAYALTQRNMLIAGCSILGLALASILIIKNIRVDKIEQVKGVLF